MKAGMILSFASQGLSTNAMDPKSTRVVNFNVNSCLPTLFYSVNTSACSLATCILFPCFMPILVSHGFYMAVSSFTSHIAGFCYSSCVL